MLDVLESDCIFPASEAKKRRCRQNFEHHSTHRDQDAARKVAKQLLPKSKKSGNNKGVYTWICTQHVDCLKHVRVKSRYTKDNANALVYDVLLSTNAHSMEEIELEREVSLHECDIHVCHRLGYNRNISNSSIIY